MSAAGKPSAAGPDPGILGPLLNTQSLPPTTATPLPAARVAEPESDTTHELSDPKPRAPRHRKPGERWEDKNVRRTFHLPRDLVDDLESLTAELDVSLSAAVREAIGGWITERRQNAATTKDRS